MNYLAPLYGILTAVVINVLIHFFVKEDYKKLAKNLSWIFILIAAFMYASSQNS